MMERRVRGPNKWVFRKEITVGNLLAIASVAAGVVCAYFSLDKRVALIEEAVAKEEVRFTRMEEHLLWSLGQKHDRNDNR